jgi:hypothetical protein
MHAGTAEVVAVDQVDELLTWVRARGPVPLLLDGWDQASIWGWDETTGSLYAHLRRNTDVPEKPSAIRIEPGDYTPAITFPETLAQYIAIAVGCSPWRVITILDEVVNQGEDLSGESETVSADEAITVVTMRAGYRIPEWPYRPQSR